MVFSKSLILAKNPTALPIIGEDLIVKASEVDILSPPPDGGIILKTAMLSYDPYQRGRMRPAGSGYMGGFPLGTPITNNSISRVVSSSSPRFKAGDVVVGNAAFSEYQVIPAEAAAKSQAQGGFDVLNNPLDLDPMLFLGALGMSGLTAYSSFYEIGKPKKGEVIFISAASGAVGQIVGQLAKREGLTVIGSVGSDEKLNFIEKELGFNSGFNYKNEKAEDALKRILKELGKDGVDIYYDNVGGEQLDAALAVLNPWGRISIFPLPSLNA